MKYKNYLLSVLFVTTMSNLNAMQLAPAKFDLWNWMKRNPGKVTLIAGVTVAAGMFAKWWHSNNSTHSTQYLLDKKSYKCVNFNPKDASMLIVYYSSNIIPSFRSTSSRLVNIEAKTPIRLNAVYDEKNKNIIIMRIESSSWSKIPVTISYPKTLCIVKRSA